MCKHAHLYRSASPAGWLTKACVDHAQHAQAATPSTENSVQRLRPASRHIRRPLLSLTDTCGLNSSRIDTQYNFNDLLFDANSKLFACMHAVKVSHRLNHMLPVRRASSRTVQCSRRHSHHDVRHNEAVFYHAVFTQTVMLRVLQLLVYLQLVYCRLSCNCSRRICTV